MKTAPSGPPMRPSTKAISEAAKFQYGVAWTATYLGLAKLNAGRIEGVLERAPQAMDLASHHHYRAAAVTARRLMAEIYQRSDEIELAEAYYRQSLDLALGPGLRPEQAHCQHGLAQVWIWSGRNDPAKSSKRPTNSTPSPKCRQHRPTFLDGLRRSPRGDLVTHGDRGRAPNKDRCGALWLAGKLHDAYTPAFPSKKIRIASRARC
jgi:hypothetical protein